jgi:hypothetical protein
LNTGVGVTWHDIEIPADSLYARFSLFDDFTDGQDDLDLYVFYGASYAYVGGSGSGTSAEQVDLAYPPAGTYHIAVHGWGTDGPDANYTLFSWGVGADAGNMAITAPGSAVLGATETLTVDWVGLDPAKKYLGAVTHAKDGAIIAITLLNIDTQ